MSRSWGDIFSRVHMTPSFQNFQRGQSNIKGPTLECRQAHLLETWQEQNAISQPRDPLRSSSQHLCVRDEILAQHDTELFEPAQVASHVCEGSAHDEQSRSESLACALCKLISELPAYKSDDKYGLYVINLLNEKERLIALDYPPEHFVMGLAVSEENRILVSRGRLGYLPPPMEGIRREELLVPVETGDGLSEDIQSPYHARILDPAKADFRSVKAWIQECSTLHPSCCASAANISGTIHVIDCLSRSILPLPADAEYLALSYVWGPQPIASSKSSDDSGLTKLTEVPANVPRTITDAMAATLALDYRYLWCDRYCIDQDDPVTKAIQLSLMDKIYEAAKITLVAASGVDDSFGLPGAGTHPLISRDLQPQAWIGSHRVVPVGPGIQATVKQSKWATRAWTFQEARLSTRCLIFSPRQLQYLCKTTSRYEALPRLPKMSSYDQDGEVNIGSVFGGWTGDQYGSKSMTILQTFQSLANELLKRDITYESDTLNAFRGILNRAEYFSFFGVPLITREGRELRKPSTNEPAGWSSDIKVSQNTQVATLLDSKSIISSSTLDPSKKRLHPNLFHAGTWKHFMYDEFPGPGEPIQPSPTLAFLHGLTWTRYEGDGKGSKEDSSTRRTGMPSWSWISLRRGPFKYRNDYAGAQEIQGDVQLNLHNGIQVWVQQKSDSPQLEWISIDDTWRQSTGKVLPEFGRHIKLETLTGDVGSCIVTMPSFGSNEYGFSITLRSLAAAEKSELRLDLDCALQDIPASGPGTYHNLGWKIALIFSSTYYNPEYEKAWQGTEPHRVYLVLQPLNGVWRRIGIMSTNDNFGVHDEVVVSVLKRETVGNAEVSFQEFNTDLDGMKVSRKDGIQKILNCARQTIVDGFDYCWVDTYCIDKTSSAELNEAINSMFWWYRDSQRCYILLSDVSTEQPDLDRQLKKSRWFTRGWTPQKLLAPPKEAFFDTD
ncbi:uncharacterized protein PAC_00061 [Phialocephala subalpina]|uniref:Heterokaryon incompatibility domain-containing protein n=1 Tax=Phialocephala subalpina TaxID=576137 RepID=A0A1L7WC00_9HELO|nr:uncharacterized protein PAC_00061 [Phialocephala subalpina]